MALTLMRHTQPLVASGVCYGQTDLALADSFERDAAAAIGGIEALPEVTAVLCSPLSRCAHLAERVALHSKHQLRPVSHFIEMDFGNWEMTPWGALPRTELDAWAADFMHYAGHGGESVAHLLERVSRGLDAAPDGALIVTHAGVIKAALAARDVPGAWEHQTPFGGLVTLD